MNNAIRTIGLWLAGVAAATTLYFQVPSSDSGVQRGMNVPTAEEGADNHQARQEWELMRLRDPATGAIPPNMRRRELEFATMIPTREAYERGLAKGSSTGPVVGNWEHRGPYNVGGRTRALALDVNNDNILLAGGVAGGMWRSTDAGGSWSRRTAPADLPSVTCIAQDRRAGKSNIWYYGTGEGFGFSSSRMGAGFYYGDGIYKSTDSGLTWRQLPSTITRNPHEFDHTFDVVWRIAADPSNMAEDEVYAATHGCIMASANGGDSWIPVLGGFNNGSIFTEVHVTREGVVYATLSGDGKPGARGIFRSENGSDWTDITPAGWPKVYRRISIGVAPSNENVVYFLAETPGYGFKAQGFSKDEWNSLWKYTYVSGDGTGTGGTWEDRSLNLPAFGGPSGDFRTQGSYDMLVKVHPEQEDVVYVGGTNLYRSTDGFATSNTTRWIGGYNTESGFDEYPNHHADQHDLVFPRTNPGTMISANDGGIYYSNNALDDVVEWTPANNGYSVTQFYTVAINQTAPGDMTIVGGAQDNGTWGTLTGDKDEPWMHIGGGDGSFCAIAGGGRDYYLSSQGGVVYKYQYDDAFEFQGITRVDPAGGSGYVFINPFVLDPSNENIMYMAAGTSLFRNSDLSELPPDSYQPPTVNWDKFPDAGQGYTVSAIGVSHEQPRHRVYIGTNTGEVYRIDDAHQGIPTPVRVTGGEFSGGYVTCIAVDPQDADRALVVYSNYEVQSLYYTEDGGDSWSPVGGNLEENSDGSGRGPSCRWASILHRGDQTIFFVGTSTGLYSTTKMEGTSTIWAQEGAETIGSVIIDMIAVRQADGFVVVGTHANGIYTATVGTTSVEREELMAAGMKLEQNVPNPVRAGATIGFTLPATHGGDHPVRLTLHDPLGKEVAVLLDRRLPAGHHTATIDIGSAGGGRLPNGIYYYRLSAGDASVVRRMVVAR